VATEILKRENDISTINTGKVKKSISSIEPYV